MALVDTYTKQLGYDLGVTEGLASLEEGGYQLTLGPSIRVEMKPLEEGCLFATEIGACPVDEEFFTTLMLANLLGQGTGGALLSLDVTGKRVQLTRELPYPLTYAEFQEKLEEFFNYAEYWKTKVA